MTENVLYETTSNNNNKRRGREGAMERYGRGNMDLVQVEAFIEAQSKRARGETPADLS